MSINTPDWPGLLADIVEYGGYETHKEAAKAIGLTPGFFSMIMKGQRKQLSWENGAKIIKAHVGTMSAYHGG